MNNMKQVINFTIAGIVSIALVLPDCAIAGENAMYAIRPLALNDRIAVPQTRVAAVKYIIDQITSHANTTHAKLRVILPDIIAEHRGHTVSLLQVSPIAMDCYKKNGFMLEEIIANKSLYRAIPELEESCRLLKETAQPSLQDVTNALNRVLIPSGFFLSTRVFSHQAGNTLINTIPQVDIYPVIEPVGPPAQRDVMGFPVSYNRLVVSVSVTSPIMDDREDPVAAAFPYHLYNGLPCMLIFPANVRNVLSDFYGITQHVKRHGLGLAPGYTRAELSDWFSNVLICNQFYREIGSFPDKEAFIDHYSPIYISDSENHESMHLLTLRISTQDQTAEALAFLYQITHSSIPLTLGVPAARYIGRENTGTSSYIVWSTFLFRDILRRDFCRLNPASAAAMITAERPEDMRQFREAFADMTPEMFKEACRPDHEDLFYATLIYLQADRLRMTHRDAYFHEQERLDSAISSWRPDSPQTLIIDGDALFQGGLLVDLVSALATAGAGRINKLILIQRDHMRKGILEHVMRVCQQMNIAVVIAPFEPIEGITAEELKMEEEGQDGGELISLMDDARKEFGVTSVCGMIIGAADPAFIREDYPEGVPFPVVLFQEYRRKDVRGPYSMLAALERIAVARTSHDPSRLFISTIKPLSIDPPALEGFRELQRFYRMAAQGI